MRTLHAYFDTKRNFQGKPVHLCTYQPDIKNYVYQPQGYGVLSRSTGVPAEFCRECKLSPCIVIEHKDFIVSLANRASTQDRMTNTQVRGLVTSKIISIMASYYQQEQTLLLQWQGNKVPECIECFLNVEVPKPPPPSGGCPGDRGSDNGFEGYYHDSSDDDSSDMADFYW